MIVLGAIAIVIFILLGAAVVVLVATDLAQAYGQWRRDRLRQQAELELPTDESRWS